MTKEVEKRLSDTINTLEKYRLSEEYPEMIRDLYKKQIDKAKVELNDLRERRKQREKIKKFK